MKGPGRRRGAKGSMGAPVEKAKDAKGSFKRLLVYLKPRRFQIVIVFIMAALSTGFTIAAPKIMGKATTKLLEGVMMKIKGAPEAKVDFKYITQILLTLFVLYVLSALFNYIQRIIMAKVSQNTVLEIRNDVNDKLSRLPLKYFDSNSKGDILSRVTNDVDNIASTLQQSITQLISALVTIIGIIIMMLTISPLMTLITFITLPLSALITKRVAKKSQVYFSEQQKELGKLNGHVEEMYSGHKIIKAFGQEKNSIEKFNEINGRLYDSGYKAEFVSSIIMPLLNFVSNIGYVLVSVIGAILVVERKIEIGDVQAFIQYSKEFAHPIVQTAGIANILQSTIASAERVFEILDEDEENPDLEDNKTIENPKGRVKFENVDFSYNKNTHLIEDMNIDVNPGETIAIVGPTGAGKTTLVNLLMRFYEINGGKITIDEVNIMNLKRGDLRSIFGMVLQDTWLFNGTIKENIGYGREGASNEEIIEAAKTAQADYFIRTLPEGYNTMLDEEASNISEGEKQLLTIARAILAEPSILILDEATSSVDTRTENLIQKAMAQLMKGRTSFVIAHRLSTIRDADLILVMNEGKIIEKGNHEELLENKGFYKELYNSQFSESNLDDEAI